MENKIIDFPKIKSPFKRETIDGKYVVTPKIEDGYEWIFDDGVLAVDKLHGTNICVYYDEGKITHISNRTQLVMTRDDSLFDLPRDKARIAHGVLNSIEKGLFAVPKAREGSGKIYGELIGPKINGNIHKVDRYYFVPFDYLKERCHWRSWVSNKYPKDFDSIDMWFKELISLFTKKMTKKEEYAEGLVFYHPDGRKAKLRRDMYSWYYNKQKEN